MSPDSQLLRSLSPPPAEARPGQEPTREGRPALPTLSDGKTLPPGKTRSLFLLVLLRALSAWSV